MNQSQGKDGIYESHFDDDDIKHMEEQREIQNKQTTVFSKHVVINDPDKNDPNLFASNKIVTAKYSWWSFLFIFLYENFNPLVKFANFYFLCVAVLECIRPISLTDGRPQSLCPLLFVLVVEAISSIHEDIDRHKADDIANNVKIEVLDKKTKQFVSIAQCDLRVGDIVHVKEGGMFPADLVFLRSEEDKAAKTCWVNTKSLDGETDNKRRQALKSTCDMDCSAESLSTLKAYVDCESPNNMTNDFSGNWTLEKESGTVVESLSINNILLRGCILKNTKGVFGAVISTGIDTKVEYVKEQYKWWQVTKKNAKQAVVSKRINKVIYLMVVFLIVMCWLGASLEMHQKIKILTSWYMDGGKMSFWLSFFRFFLLCYQFIPVSLYVSISVIYNMQSINMMKDPQMYDEVNDEPMRVRTNVLNDGLGQVGYIFSDKTGTLTANLMQFRKCLVDGVSYGLGESDIGRNLKGKKDLDIKVQPSKPVIKKGIARYCKYEDGSESHPGRTFKEDLRKEDDHAEKLKYFLLNMALNHTCIRNVQEDGTVELNTSSPDEQAFVSGASFLGIEFLGMDYETNIVKLNILDTITDVRVLHIIPYESSRKRMSIIVELPNGSIVLFCKGADSIMFELHDPAINNSRFIETIACQVSTWAEEAFRTMVFGYKPLSREEFTKWITEYEKVCEDPTQKQLRASRKPNKIDQLQFKIENGLILQGASAVEDGLQEGVPETLAQLSDAGIHIWMITGDKVGTAKNIAIACNLLKPNEMKLIEFTKEAVDKSLLDKGGRVEELTDRISPSALQEIEWQMLEAEKEGDIEKANRILGEFEASHPGLLATRMYCEALAANILNNDPETQSHTYALVIDELFIDFLALSCRQAFLVVAQSCKAVIACRARKDQKAKLTRLVRKGNQEVVTLGIGDGANDVEMLRTAHIGVGIIGKEGSQAVNNADYAIGQFRFLARLILVYGHRSYRGITLASLAIMFKNIVFTLVQFFYTFLSYFSGTRNQTFLAVMFYNTLFTMIFPLYLGVFDRDVSDANCFRFPQLHRQGISHKLFDVNIFLVFVVSSIYKALVITFITNYSLLDISYASGSIEVYAFGVIETTITILVANLTCSSIISSSSKISRRTSWFCFLSWIIGILIISQFSGIMPYYYKLFDFLFFSPATYLSTILAICIALLPTLMWKAIRLEWKPSLADIILDVQLRNADADQLRDALEEMEKNRALELELKTIKSLPKNAEIPNLLNVSENTIHVMEQQIEKRHHKEPSPIQEEDEEEEEEEVGELPSLVPEKQTPYQLMKTGNARRSIRSIAGLRALTICEEIHGPSYDAQSYNAEAQEDLIHMINSHDWRVEEKSSILSTIKTTIRNVSHGSSGALSHNHDDHSSPKENIVNLSSPSSNPPPLNESVSSEVILEDLQEEVNNNSNE